MTTSNVRFSWMLLWAFAFSSLSLTLQAQDPPQYGTPFAGVPDTRDINLYQVNIRAFSQASNFAGVTARLDNIADVGTNVVYLMPIFPVGEDSRSKVSTATSPYSIKDFSSTGSEFGSLDDLRELVDGAHERGMAVILDFVVNQTSWDHPWITEHPDWYIRDADGVIQPLTPFPDVAALDLSNQDMRAALIESLRYWVFAANVDGFRFDYANNPPIEFWQQINGNLRTITSHDLILFAEGDRQENFDADFDINFGDRWYYLSLLPIKNGGSVVNATREINAYEYARASGSQQVTRYTGNHDTSGDGTPIEVFGGNAGVLANFVVSAYMKGVPFLYGGQEVGFERRIPFPWDQVKIDWDQGADVFAEFKKILEFRTRSTAVRRGQLTDYSNENVSAFTKTTDDERVVVLANLRGGTSGFRVPGDIAGTYSDAYTGASVTLTAGQSISLSSFEYQTLTSDNTPPDPSISLTPSSATVATGGTTQLTAQVNASDEEATFASSDESVATVSASGLVTGVGVGTATITASAAGASAEATINVVEANVFTVHFYPPAGWGNDINIYYWDAVPEGIIPTVSWPGVATQNDGDGWYSYVFNNVTSTNLIFNDGFNQTADLSRSEDGWYYNGAWTATRPNTDDDGNDGGGGQDGSVFLLKNRWLDAYLYDGGAEANYGNVTDETAQWEQVFVDGYSAFRNVATGDLLNLENDREFAEVNDAGVGFWSAQWALEPYDGFTRLRNRFRGDRYLDTERRRGFAQASGGLFAGSYSTHWQLESVGALSSRTVQDGGSLSAYPVPTTGTLTVDVPGPRVATGFNAQLTDLGGRVVYSESFAGGGTHQLDVRHLAAGAYTLTVNDGRRVRSTRVMKVD